MPRGSGRGTDYSNPVIAVNHDACILCDRCVRACDDLQGNDVIGRVGKGYATRIAFDLDDPMGESTCVTCGECVQACPTGALTNKPDQEHADPAPHRAQDRRSDVPVLRRGLRDDLQRRRGAQHDRLRRRPGAAGQPLAPVREGALRVRLHAVGPAPHVPLIRREESYPKGAAVGRRGRRRCAAERKPGGLVDMDVVMPHFREASWEEALDLAAGRLKAIHEEGGPPAHRRVRLGEVLQRGGLPLPEAHPRGLRHEQRRPLHPALPRLERRRALRGRGLGRRLHHLRGHHQRRRRDPGGHEHHGQPSRRVVVLQAGQAPGHEAHRGRPAPGADRRPRRHRLPDQAGDRRRASTTASCTR